MSALVRRVKSFSVKKHSNSDEIRVKPRIRKKLNRQKSASMEYIPLPVRDVEQSELFIRQRRKLEEHEQERFKRGKLHKRKSVSCDEATFKSISDKVELRQNDKRAENRTRYNTVDVWRDLITEFQNEETDDGAARQPSQFPVSADDEDDVIVRPSKGARERPKTVASTLLTPAKEKIFDFKHVAGLEVGNRCFKILPREILRLNDTDLVKIGDKGQTWIQRNVSLKKGTKWISKKELEMKDQDGNIYRLYFHSKEEARCFADLEKARHVTSSPVKNNTPWMQLRKLLKKRSSRDVLESKGILKNEPIFGNTLDQLCSQQNLVPEVVVKITRLIEEKQNITSMGLYRASANLATVQNIRFEINCARWEVLDRYKDDVDVLAGTLKLFFRELKEPLIGRDVFVELSRAADAPPDVIDGIIATLPPPNKATLLHIMRHLLKVCRYKSENKMDFHNIAICWGPTLMTLPDTCVNLVAETTEFTRIVEQLLCHYSKIPGFEDAEQDPVEAPDFVHELIRKLTERIEQDIEVEGIYRKSGSNAKIDKIMKLIDKQNIDIDLKKCDIHDLCCVLKKYVALMRKTLLPDEFFHRYAKICDTIPDRELGAEVARMLTETERRHTIGLLFGHLYKVVQYQHKNKMSLVVLSDIWMTTLVAGVHMENLKEKMPKYAKLFLILINLNDATLPDVVVQGAAPRSFSKYDNVPDDIYSQSGFTKL